MTLRRQAGHLRTAPGWRRSGDETYWENLVSEDLPSVPHPPRAPRPQSAIEGRQLDGWLEHIQKAQDHLRAPTHHHHQLPAFNDRTSSMPVLNKEPTSWRQKCFPSFSRGSSPGGSSSFCESLPGSRESLQSGFLSQSDHRRNCEKAHIMQTPKKEQAQLSYLAPVKLGWLPVQRRVMMVEDASRQQQLSDHSAGHVKLKQPITPTIQKTQATPKANDEEVDRSHTSPSALGVRTWQTSDQGSPPVRQVPEKQNWASSGGERPVGWQALRKGWNTNRVFTFPGGSKSKEHPTGTGSDPNTKSPLMKTSSALKHSPLNRSASVDPCRPPTPLQGTNNTETCKSQPPPQRTSGVQPVKATVPLGGTNGTQPSQIQTSSAVTTLIPQNKAGISSITISSKKVSRSSSLPGGYNRPSWSRGSPSPPLDPSMEPGKVTVQRKATIVKVTEKRVMSNPVLDTTREGTPPASYALDTVVHRRKATIIKVTEHRESYTPSKATSKPPEYRHSYTEGLYQDTWSRENRSQNNPPPPEQNLASNPFTADPEKNAALHRSTLRMVLSGSPAISAPASSEVPPKAVGRRTERPRRPLSCYGNMIGHTEVNEENVTPPPARKWSYGLPRGKDINPLNPDSSSIIPGKAAKEAGQLAAETLEPNGGRKEEVSPKPEDGARRASPSLTLIKAPDPNTDQSKEEVLALNAAAIIANIKLQRQLSKKKTPNGDLEKDSAASPQGNTDAEKSTQSPFSQSRAQSPKKTEFVLLDAGTTSGPVSLQQALNRSRPDFISQSQGRVRELRRKAQERKQRPPNLNEDISRPKDKAIAGKEMQSRSKQAVAEVRRKREERKKREICLSNRQRAEAFKKKLLAEVLQRSHN